MEKAKLILEILAVLAFLRMLWVLIQYLGGKNKFITKLPPQGRVTYELNGDIITDVLTGDQTKKWDLVTDTLIDTTPDEKHSGIDVILFWVGGYKWMGITVVSIMKFNFTERTMDDRYQKTGVKDVKAITIILRKNISELPLQFSSPFIAETVEDIKFLGIFYFLKPLFEVVHPLLFMKYLMNNNAEMNNIHAEYRPVLKEFSEKLTYLQIQQANMVDPGEAFLKSLFDLNGMLIQRYGVKAINISLIDYGLEDKETIEASKKAGLQTMTNAADLLAAQNKTKLKEQDEQTAIVQKRINLLDVEILNETKKTLGESYNTHVKYTSIQNSKLTTYVEGDGKSVVAIPAGGNSGGTPPPANPAGTQTSPATPAQAPSTVPQKPKTT